MEQQTTNLGEAEMGERAAPTAACIPGQAWGGCAPQICAWAESGLPLQALPQLPNFLATVLILINFKLEKVFLYFSIKYGF